MDSNPMNPVPVTQVWLIEDHDDCRRAVARVIDQIPGMACPHSFATCEAALALLAKAPAPQVVLLDVGLPGMNGIEGIKRIKAVAPSTHVIMLTVYDDHDKVFTALCAGASGYLLKNSPEQSITAAIEEVLRGGAPINPRVARRVLDLFAGMAPSPKTDYGLSAREKEILELVVHGFIKKEIADKLALSYYTVDNHLRSIYHKLHVHTRGAVVAKALQEKLI
jgi:DNA-binding NarL/FixJ family response regulator